MKAVFFDLTPKEKQFFPQTLSDFELVLNEGPLITSVDPATEILSVRATSRVDDTLINQLPNLKLIATRSTGYDNIDLTAAKAKGVVVVNVPAYGEETVAEFTFALLLAVSRRLVDGANQVKLHRNFETDNLQGFDLQGKVLGVVGTGKIGSHVIKIARGFGMKVIAYDAYPNINLSHELGFSYVSLDELMGGSDIISYHVPGRKETEHMLSMDNLNKLKRGVVIINTSRGVVLQTVALIKGLSEGLISYLGLDVLEEEQDLKENKASIEVSSLLDMENVILTPHNAFNSLEANQRILDTTVENIKAFTSGSPVNLVKDG